jgi:hypothetical protein
MRRDEFDVERSLTGSTEPGLVLTPPAQGSEADDGYLTASRSKFDADCPCREQGEPGGRLA